MNLENNIKDTIRGIEIPDAIKYIGQPLWEDIIQTIGENNKYELAYVVKEQQIKILYSGIKAKLKIDIARQSLMKLYMINYLQMRDKVIMKKNEMIKKQNLYKHDLDLNDINIIAFIYESQHGARRFPTQFAYDYFIKTGREPYRIS